MFYNSSVNWVRVSSKWSTASLTTYDYMFYGSSIYDTTGGKDCSGSNVAIGTEKTFAIPFSTGVSGCLTPPFS